MLTVSGLIKRYGAVTVLDLAELSIRPGEVVAVIGENGAGKSTLAKCLAGIVRPDAAHVELDGRAIVLGSPRVASSHGIGLLPQELAEVPDLTVAENIVLGRWPSRSGWTGQRAIRAAAEAQVERLGMTLDVTRTMGTLGLGDRQIVELCKVLFRRAQYLILDEPTAALDATDADRLYAIVRRLADQGVGIVFISHRLDEVHRFSDRVDVLRNGRCVASRPTVAMSHDELIHLMVGDEVPPPREAAPDRTGKVRLAVRRWHSKGPVSLDGLDLDVSAGEVVGVFGLRGSGHEVLAEGLAGTRRDLSGEIVVGDLTRKVPRSPRRARRLGISSMPADRKLSGLVLDMSVAANVSLGRPRAIATAGIIRRRREQRLARAAVAHFDIRCTAVEQPVSQLSGGNQQKVLVASRLESDPSIIVAHEPTRGVDVGARAQLHRLLRRRAEQGAAVVVITTDVEEVVTVSDRVIVIRAGRVAAALSGDAITQQKVIATANGSEHM